MQSHRFRRFQRRLTSFSVFSICTGDDDGERFRGWSSLMADGDVYGTVSDVDAIGGVFEMRGDERKSVGDGIGVLDIDGDNSGFDCWSGILCSFASDVTTFRLIQHWYYDFCSAFVFLIYRTRTTHNDHVHQRPYSNNAFWIRFDHRFYRFVSAIVSSNKCSKSTKNRFERYWIGTLFQYNPNTINQWDHKCSFIDTVQVIDFRSIEWRSRNVANCFNQNYYSQLNIIRTIWIFAYFFSLYPFSLYFFRFHTLSLFVIASIQMNFRRSFRFRILRYIHKPQVCCVLFVRFFLLHRTKKRKNYTLKWSVTGYTN